MQIYASLPIYIIIQRRIYKEKQFFFTSLAGIELATSGSAVQYLILPYLQYLTTAARLDLQLQKLIFNSKLRSQGPTSFPRWRPFSK